MSRKSTVIVTASIMLSLFMASMESTVVATAMPTIVGQLGGLTIYSWVFSTYMLSSTTSVPIFGKLSDLYGRRPIFAGAMALFLPGSVLSGLVMAMPQLIAARAMAGAPSGWSLLLPLSLPPWPWRLRSLPRPAASPNWPGGTSPTRSTGRRAVMCGNSV